MPTPARIEMMPPPALPAMHFAAAFACLLLGAVGLVAAAADLAAGAYLAFPVVGTTHLFTLGWITLSIMGVLYQFAPVGLGVPIASVRAAQATFAAFLPGVLLFVLGTGLARPALSHTGAALLAAAILGFVGNLGVTLARARTRGITWWGLAIGATNLVAVLALGFALAVNLETGFMSASRLAAVAAHAHLALLGWIMPIIVGVGHRLLPMFLLSPSVDRRPAAVALVLLGAGAPVLAAGLGFERHALAWAGAALAYGGLLAWLLQARLYFRQRRLVRLDASMRLAAAGALALAAAAAVAPVLLLVGRSHAGLVTTYGLLAILGVSLFVMGHYYRIVPHFVWRQRYMPLAGSQPLPRPSDMVAPRVAAAAGTLLAVGVVLLVAGALVTAPVATRAGALAFAAGVTLAVAQMATIAWPHKEDSMDTPIADTPSVTRTITPDETVHAIVERYPDTRAVFEGLGIHVCCGGDVPLAVAAERDGVSLDRLLAEISRSPDRPSAAGGEPVPAAAPPLLPLRAPRRSATAPRR